MDDPIKFACDAMLGALARWLRAAGYDCFWQEGIEDEVLVELAKNENRILLTADSGIFKRKVVYSGQVKALPVEREMPRDQQVAHILRILNLPRLAPRCMTCGGELLPLDLQTAAEIVPPKALKSYKEFFRCGRCGKAYWHGTHWISIDRRLQKLGFEINQPM
jgi:uncharacterized protein